MNSNKYDVIIIGSGLGGLTAGAALAKKGKKVLVLEQHFTIGGCATTYKRQGITYEVGLHEMDWGTPDHDMKHFIFKKLGILNKLPLVKLPQVWRIKTESEQVTIVEGRENVIEELSRMFPEEKRGLKRYMRAMKHSSKLAGRMPADMNLFRFFCFPITHLPFVIADIVRRKERVGQRMDKYIQSSKLKNILNINSAYYTNNPYDLSWSYYSCAQYNYYHSAVFVKGGSQVLSDTLGEVITSNGGELRTLCDVNSITLEGNKATGVTYYDKRKKEHVTLQAKRIIANTDPANLFGSMVPKELQEPHIDKLKPATSLYTVYITFKEAPSKHYHLAYSNFIVEEKDLNQNPKVLWASMNNRAVQERPFVFVDYSTIDSGLVPEGDCRSFGVLTSITQLDEWDSLDPETYSNKKEELAQALFGKLEKHYPGISELIERYEVSTPKTIQRYIRTRNGTAYGFENKDYMMLGRTPKKSKTIKNLYYSGAWTNPGGGFTGAIVSGYQTALEMKFPMRWTIILKTLLCCAIGFIAVEIIIFIVKLIIGAF